MSNDDQTTKQTPKAPKMAHDTIASEIRAAFENGKEQVDVVSIDNHRSVAVVPPGFQVLELPEKHRERPVRVETDHHVNDLDSFVEYLNRFSDEDSIIFADPAGGGMDAVLDYHQPGAAESGKEYGNFVQPRHGKHVISFRPLETPEWKAWMGANGKALTQETFAEFIEDQARFIVRPDAATMMDVATTLQASKGAQFRSSRRLDNGQVQLNYVEEVTGSAGRAGQLEIPQTFTVALAPFIGCKPVEVEARFRYRLNGAQLVLLYKVIGHEQVVRDITAQMRHVVHEATGLMVVVGSR